MNETSTSLGPLELVDGRWILGDVGRPGGGAWVEFGADGLHAHARDSGEEVIPWHRIMSGMTLVLGGRYPGRGGNVTLIGLLGGLPGPFHGRGGGYLRMTVRTPYDDHAVFFDRHPRRYPLMELAVLEELLTQTVDAGEAHRLADDDWLAGVVERLARPQGLATRNGVSRAVTEARQADRSGLS
ncbi:hypothetical protein ACIGZJ_22165 [Kitasatospora sp. NPDC052868]|uniref:hypothetical protein n=1 Tax=Kitasatospora sp. NPDC052868 TaxID=3364060 RepID=UPI0037C64C7E